MNSKFTYLAFHPEYLVDLLRAGGRFSIEQSFSIPLPNATQAEISNFVEKRFPSLSEERYEVWLKFRVPDDTSSSWFSLENIISSHFYSKHRQEATHEGILRSLEAYSIPVLQPLDREIEHVIEVYDSKIREHTAISIIKTWFPELKISNEFIDQIKIGYKYQQSPAPEKLPPISSELIWAHLVAYNHGRRQFEERPRVLLLQDIQEVFRRTDVEFKQELRSIGDKYSLKFSDLLDNAEKSIKSGTLLSNWLLENKAKEKTYLFDLDQLLSGLGKQKSFFYSALLYFYWREKILDGNFSGKLSEKSEIWGFLKNANDNDLKQSTAEALFTIVYAGGPRVFQQALIEARIKVMGHLEPVKPSIPKKPSPPNHPSENPKGIRLFEYFKKIIGGIFYKAYDSFSEPKKKEIQKDLKKISSTITKLKSGEFNYDQYVKLCLLFEIEVEQFDDYKKSDGLNSLCSDIVNQTGSDNPSVEAVTHIGSEDPFGEAEGQTGTDIPSGEAGDQTEFGNPSGEEGTPAGSEDPSGEAEDQTGTDTPSSETGDQTESGNPSGEEGTQTGSEDPSGEAANQTGTDMPSDETGDQTESGNPSGEAGKQTGSEDTSGEAANQNGTDIPSGETGDPLGEEGTPAGSEDPSGEAEDQTGTDSPSSETGDQTESGNPSGEEGTQTGSEDPSGEAANQTGTDTLSGETGDQDGLKNRRTKVSKPKNTKSADSSGTLSIDF